MNTKSTLLLLSLFSCAAAHATNFTGITVDNSVSAVGSIIAGSGGSTTAGFYSPSGYVNVGGLINSGSSITASGLITGSNGANLTGYLSVLGIAGRARIGPNSAATGNLSLAIGDAASAQSYSSVVIGKNNVVSSGYSTTAWVLTDPLFVVGNGADATHQNNAFVVLKDGTVKIAKRQGDVGMGRFSSVPADQ